MARKSHITVEWQSVWIYGNTRRCYVQHMFSGSGELKEWPNTDVSENALKKTKAKFVLLNSLKSTEAVTCFYKYGSLITMKSNKIDVKNRSRSCVTSSKNSRQALAPLVKLSESVLTTLSDFELSIQKNS